MMAADGDAEPPTVRHEMDLEVKGRPKPTPAGDWESGRLKAASTF